MSSGSGSKLGGYLENIKQKAIAVVKESIDKALIQIMPDFENALELAYKECADEWYNARPPEVFEGRTYALRDEVFMVTDRGKDYLDIDYNSGAYVGGGSFDAIFKEGYHGGASHNGGYYWRKPHPYYRYWGRPAESTASIYSLYEAKVPEVCQEYSDKLRTLILEIAQKNIGKAYT